MRHLGDQDLENNGSNEHHIDCHTAGQDLYRSGQRFETAGLVHRLRISSDGHLGINTDFTGSQLWRVLV